MQVEFGKNYFELMGLPRRFEVDSEALALNYRELQRAIHPDRFANASDQEMRLSVQHASLINEAFSTLKNPLKRARYLLELSGVPLDDTDTQMPAEFLLEQMALREGLAEVQANSDPFSALDQVRSHIEGRERELAEVLHSDFNDGSRASLERARGTVRKMQFMQRLLEEAGDLEETLVHEA